MKSSTGILTIDLAAIQENWRRVNAQLATPASAAAVVKADAYGLGAEPVARALAAVGCQTFFVATLDEGLAMRACLPDATEIYILGGARPGTEDAFIDARLTPVIFTLDALNRWRLVCVARRVQARCAVKVDTGMTRLGLDRDEFTFLCNESRSDDAVDVTLIMSHLACADEPEHPLNNEQLLCFQQVAKLAARAWPKARLSLANSSGVFLGAKWHFDLVRTGAALYGINPCPARTSPVLPVVHLRLPILQKRPLQRPVSIGYGASAHKEPPGLLVAVAGGYADGLHRTLGARGEGMIEGQCLPVIGRVSMDTTLFDASSLAPDAIANAESIDIINEQLNVDVLTARNGALGYELLTGLGKRYHRHYLKGSV